jgi:UBX domain-containing protein 1
VSVGLIDKRSEDYVETFSSFSGHGNSLGSSTTPLVGGAGSVDGIIDPTSLPSEPPAVDASLPTTSIQVRLVSGQRRVITINTSATVGDLAAHVVTASAGNDDRTSAQSFMLVAGFPPKPLVDLKQTIDEAGLKGAQVTQKQV